MKIFSLFFCVIALVFVLAAEPIQAGQRHRTRVNAYGRVSNRSVVYGRAAYGGVARFRSSCPAGGCR